MSRRADLLRRTLLAIERLEGDPSVRTLWIEGYSQFELGNIVYLLREEGYLRAPAPFDPFAPEGIAAAHLAGGLTWAGRDLLDTIRDDGVWAWVTERLAGYPGEPTIEVVATLAVAAEKALSRGALRPQPPA